MRRFALALAIFSMGASCALPQTASPPATPVAQTRPEVVIRLLTGGDRPGGTLTYRGRVQQANLGTYCWTRPGVGECADATIEYLVVGSHVTVPRGSVVRIVGEPDGIEARLGTVMDHGNHNVEFHPVQTLHLEDGFDRLKASPGVYSLDLFIRVQRGDAALAFGIRLV